MCDECDELQPRYVAYFGKAGGKLWQPPQNATSTPRYDDRPTMKDNTTRFMCDDLSQAAKWEKN
jgi:hypothetical protein